jgi:hypothetical protein
MRKPDDHCLPDDQLCVTRRHAHRAIPEADAIRRFPTPVANVRDTAKVLVAEEDALDVLQGCSGFLVALAACDASDPHYSRDDILKLRLSSSVSVDTSDFRGASATWQRS